MEQARDPNPVVLGVITDGTFANFSELFTTLVVQNVTLLPSDTVFHSYLESFRPCFICFFFEGGTSSSAVDLGALFLNQMC